MAGQKSSKASFILGFIVLLLGSYTLFCVVKGINPLKPNEVAQVVSHKKESLNDYSFKDLSEVSAVVSKMDDEKEIKDYLRDNYLLDIAYQPTDELLSVETSDGRILKFRFIGYNHDVDERGNKIGLSFMCADPAFIHSMNEDLSKKGGWGASDLRAYLNDEFFALLPQDLKDAIIPCQKKTNDASSTLMNIGSTTNTTDKLWLLSASEVCGPISWYVTEESYGVNNKALDDLLSSEGTQYEYFKNYGVSDTSDKNGCLALNYASKPCGWWYRTANAVSMDEDDRYYFGVMEGGYPHAYLEANSNIGVVFGFCI